MERTSNYRPRRLNFPRLRGRMIDCLLVNDWLFILEFLSEEC